ncbi:MAG: hypothetical protein QOJ72_2222 [Nocardioidaceae bacterium]|jgi:hypothetical protein|nr:hypothetical protein [Nocardioidaceae bacterium]
MHEALSRLINGSVGVPSSGPVAGLPETARGRELSELLAAKNGFLSPDSALWVRGCGTDRNDLEQWNALTGWRATYGRLIDGLFFFAEDAFASQWCLSDSSVLSFDPESGELSEFAPDLARWAQRLIADYDHLTGAPITRAWQAINGTLPHGKRMVPAIPFMLGGLFDLSSVNPIDCWEAAEFRASLWQQTKDLPDGTTVSFKITD